MPVNRTINWGSPTCPDGSDHDPHRVISPMDRQFRMPQTRCRRCSDYERITVMQGPAGFIGT